MLKIRHFIILMTILITPGVAKEGAASETNFMNDPPQNKPLPNLFSPDHVDYILKNAGPIDNYDQRWYLGSCESPSGVIRVGTFRINKEGKDFLIFFDQAEEPILIWELNRDLREFKMDGCQLIHLERASTLSDTQESISQIKRQVLVDFANPGNPDSITFNGKVYQLPKFSSSAHQNITSGTISYHEIRRDAEVKIIGNLGIPIGQIITLEGKRAPSSKVSNVQTLRVEKINGVEFDESIRHAKWPAGNIQISNVEVLPENETIILKGYEFLYWSGDPQINWHLSVDFMVTEVIAPTSLELANK